MIPADRPRRFSDIMQPMAGADYFADLTFKDYAGFALGVGSDGTVDKDFPGGVFAGKGTAWERTAEVDTAAGARLVHVKPPKIFVRWFDSKALAPDPKAPVTWAPAAMGSWWSSDAMADVIVRRTRERFGEQGDSGLVAREYSAVRWEWGSDMQGVIACELTSPIRALVGVGRPVITKGPNDPEDRVMGNRELQYVILTQYPHRTFRAHEFMKLRFVGRSTDFTRWWLKEGLVDKRRAQTRSEASSRAPHSAYPAGTVRVPPRP